MNRLKIFENENDYVEFSADTAEILLCKQLVNPINTDYVQFVLNNFNVEWLATDVRKRIYKIAETYHSKYDAIPSQTTMNLLFKNKKCEAMQKDLAVEYDKIFNFNESAIDPKLVKNAIKTFIKAKSVYFAISSNVDSLEQDGTISDLIAKFEKITQLDLSDDLGVEYFENIDNHIEDLAKQNNKIPFGLTELDKLTAGGLPVNDTCLFIIMAQPGLGKSMLMSTIAYNWLFKNKKVLIVSLEMSEHMYSKRFDALFTGFSSNEMRLHTNELLTYVKGAKSGIPNALLQIKEFPTGTFTTAMLKQFLKKLKQQKNFVPDIIFVDYLNIMRPNGANAGAMSLYEKGGRIAEELRAVSSEMKIPIVTATQSNRSNAGSGYAGENIDLSNVSESSGISATADGLVALFQRDGERDLNRINCKILKNRLGGYVGNIFPLYVDYGKSLRVSDWNSSDDAVNDDVLGNVKDASNAINIKKSTLDETQSADSIIEDI